MINKLDKKLSDDEVVIFYACDENYIKFLVVSLTSLKANADKKRNYKIYVLCSKVSEKMEGKVFALQDERFKIEFVNVEGEIKRTGKELPLRDYFSKTTYYRLLIADLFPNYKKALYIDSDTIILGDASKLYDTELDNCYVGACHEQVMIQNQIFGEYVEKVVGVNRNEYFNAGVLLINCELFREEKLFNEFTRLLSLYDFSVTQDEDYLNAMCKDRVRWLAQDWNVEVFGNIPVEEKDLKLIHYIMVSKPWHYRDCRLSEYFWKYAEKTSVYDEIIEELENYSKEKVDRDASSQIALENLAKEEIFKANNCAKEALGR